MKYNFKNKIYFHINRYIIFYGYAIATLLLIFINHYLAYHSIPEDYYLNLPNIENVNLNTCKEEIKNSNILESRATGNLGGAKRITNNSGSYSIANMNRNKSSSTIEITNLFTSNSNKFNHTKFNNLQYQEISYKKHPPIKISGVDLEFGEILSYNKNKNLDIKWKHNICDEISKEISKKAINLPDIKFTKEELEKRMDLTTNASERCKVIIDLENSQDPYKSQLFLYVKQSYDSIGKIDSYECFLLDYHTSSDARIKVDAIIDEMKSSEKIIRTNYNINDYNNTITPEENAGIFSTIVTRPYVHTCMNYEGPNGEKIFSVFSSASGIINSPLNNNILNDYYKFHLISNKNFVGRIDNQYASSFIYQEKPTPGLINNVSLQKYNKLYNFINEQKVYKKIEELISLKYMSDSEIVINKLKQVGIIK